MRNATDDFTFVQWDPTYTFGAAPPPTAAPNANASSRDAAAVVGPAVTFSEFYDVAADPWQMKNLWGTLALERKASLEEEIERRFACTGTRTTPSNCE